MMTQVDENPYGSTNSSGANLNVLQHGREAVKYKDVFYNPLGATAEQTPYIKAD